MNFFDFLDLIIALLYFLGSIIYLGHSLGGNRLLQKASTGLISLGFALHSLDLGFKIYQDPAFAVSQGQFYFSLLAWTFLLIYFFVCLKFKHRFLALAAGPLSLILFCSSIVVNPGPTPVPEQLSGLWFGLHIATLFLSIACLAMAFGAGVCYIYADKQIKNKSRPNRLRRGFPALTSFDRINHWAVSLGFPMFTVGILSGFLWAGFTWKRYFSFDPKELFSLIIWFLFAYLFHQRFALGWKGRKPAIMAIWLFLLSLASLLLINFLLPTHHAFKL